MTAMRSCHRQQKSVYINDEKTYIALTIIRYISSQLQLEADAREALPYEFNTCTKPLGPLRQTLFSCLTCNPPPNDPLNRYTPAGVCYSCSISCHGDHELVELFSRRDFECDCGTCRIQSATPCSLRVGSNACSDQPRKSNQYNQNFQNLFCDCAECYDPHKQEGTMFQCLGLGSVSDGGCGEDWWHPECILGITKDWRKNMRDPSDANPPSVSAVNSEPPALSPDGFNPTTDGEAEDINANEEIANDDGDELPPGFPREADFEHFICYKCVDAFPWIKYYAGAPGFLALSNRDEQAVENLGSQNNQSILENGAINTVVNARDATAPTIKKRPHESAQSDNDSNSPHRHKKQKGHQDGETTAQSDSQCRIETLPPAPQVSMSMFLKADFRAHLCRCPSCFPKLRLHPQLLDEEDTYEPPLSETGSEVGSNASVRSAGSARSLLDRGEAALSNMDRVRAIEGVMAYNHMRDKVKSFLKPFAESGQAVGAGDIKEYFEKLRGDQQTLRETAMNNGDDGSGGGSHGQGGDTRREQDGC